MDLSDRVSSADVPATWHDDKRTKREIKADNRAATLDELFFDLVFVVSINRLNINFLSKLDEQEAIDSGLDPLQEWVALFLPTYFVWYICGMYTNQFQNGSILVKVFMWFAIGLLALLGCNVDACGNGDYENEGVGIDAYVCGDYSGLYATLRFIIALAYVRVALFGRHHALVRNYALYHVFWNVVVAIFWIGIGLTKWTHDPSLTSFVATWWTAIAMDLAFLVVFTPLFYALMGERRWQEKFFVPVNVHLCVERHALFIVIALGESLIAAVSFDPLHHGSDEHPYSKWTGYLTSFIVVTLAFLIKEIYLDAGMLQYGKHLVHALKRNFFYHTAFLSLHIALVGSILLLGAVFEQAVHSGYFHTENELWVNCVAMCVVLASLALIQLSSTVAEGHENDRIIHRYVRIGMRFFASICVSLFGFIDYHDIKPFELYLTFAGFLSGLAILDAIGRQKQTNESLVLRFRRFVAARQSF
jgi:low temperature requirement protein LtrA